MNTEISNPILVTGAKGFIGANLVRRLILDGNTVHIFLRHDSNMWRLDGIMGSLQVHKVDLCNKIEVESAINKIKPRTIFHLASYGAYPFQKEVEIIKDVNLNGTVNLLSACESAGFDSFINTGSSSEYGFKDKPMKETNMVEPNSDYAVFKSEATKFCEEEANSKNLPIVTLRPFSVYGPYEEPTRLVPKLITNLLKNDCPPLVSPETARDYIYVEDMIEAYLITAEMKGLCGEIINIGSGVQTTIKEIVGMVIGLTGAKVKPKWGTMEQRIWDQNIWQADISKAREVLNWSPKNDLRSGLAKTIEWFKHNLELYK
ncbi:MAG: NAD-dependent epimerase/dehydratase family protein [bacterium]|nr:NAD-dependent epimerase/dehydratase family protein [bacterium]